MDLASLWVDRASADLASRRIADEEKLPFLRRKAGFSWGKKIMGAVGSRKPPAHIRRDVINSNARGAGESSENTLTP